MLYADERRQAHGAVKFEDGHPWDDIIPGMCVITSDEPCHLLTSGAIVK
jgi:hypothetical protein